MTIPLEQDERERLDAICGCRKALKRGAFVREAVVMALSRAGRKAR